MRKEEKRMAGQSSAAGCVRERRPRQGLRWRLQQRIEQAGMRSELRKEEERRRGERRSSSSSSSGSSGSGSSRRQAAAAAVVVAAAAE